MSGSAISGVLMNVLMMVTKGLLQKFYAGHSDTSTDRIEAFVFFGFSAVVVAFCIIGYLYIVRKPFIQHHVAHLFSILEADPQHQDDEDEVKNAEPAKISRVDSSDDVVRASGQGARMAETPPTTRSQDIYESADDQPLSSSVPGARPGTRVHKSYSQDQLLSEHFSNSDAASKIQSWASGEEIHQSPNDYSLRKLMEPARRRQRSSCIGTSMPKGMSLSPRQNDTAVGGGDLEQPFVGTGEGKAFHQTDEEDLDIEPTVKEVLAKVQGYGVAVLGVFFVSLYIFPGFLTVLCAKGFWGTGKDADDWMRLVLLTAFNVTDLVGRLVAPWFGRVLFGQHTLFRIYVVAFLRLGFVPIAWLCVLGDADTVYLPGIMTLLLGFTNGCLGSLCMMGAPQQCESHEQELAGTIMSVFLMLGITTGALGQDAMTPAFDSMNFGKCHD
eukprot:TRINITY_DN9510_c0_g1_i3.p1 TRINITY_DN9510_c0_g1~~TRINITY_DN9510_c0_g1_i3.p1  ORF type:complete len:441 (+),score=98.58 TRINITY_DN9510_c0_g1_i3:83-1405(+)